MLSIETVLSLLSICINIFILWFSFLWKTLPNYLMAWSIIPEDTVGSFIEIVCYFEISSALPLRNNNLPQEILVHSLHTKRLQITLHNSNCSLLTQADHRIFTQSLTCETKTRWSVITAMFFYRACDLYSHLIAKKPSPLQLRSLSFTTLFTYFNEVLHLSVVLDISSCVLLVWGSTSELVKGFHIILKISHNEILLAFSIKFMFLG